MIETSFGHLRPAFRAAAIAPIAMASLCAKTAVGLGPGWASSASISRPPSDGVGGIARSTTGTRPGVLALPRADQRKEAMLLELARDPPQDGGQERVPQTGDDDAQGRRLAPA